LVASAAVLLPVGYWAFWHHQLKRFMELREGMFYRVAQPSEFGFRYLIKNVGIKTVVSVQLYDFRLRRGLISFRDPDGCRESECVTRLGARAVQWPMGTEKSWPWLTPWQFEQFFQLLDNPRNWPVAVHCQGGRHRTGTLSALFRLEYDRWDADRALAEMYSFKFGGAIRLQEHNLRTYLPRPHPTEAEWAALRHDYAPLLTKPAADYESLVRELRAARGDKLDLAVARYVVGRRAFSLPLVQRLIDEPGDPLAEQAVQAAADCLKKQRATTAAWSMAAALVADFGSAAQQQELLSLLGDAEYQQASAERFDAVVDGVTNRYTPNRITFLRPLLDNEARHLRAGTTQYRYCDTAVARLSAIVDENFPDAAPGWGIDAWNNGRVAARKWLAAHPAERQLSRLKQPTGHTVVERGDPPSREDLSRARL
jgi:tyrosine-protein phosphatase SIW14